LDMLDRIEPREQIKTTFGWSEANLPEELQHWREIITGLPKRERYEAPITCRTIQGFIGTKPVL